VANQENARLTILVLYSFSLIRFGHGTAASRQDRDREYVMYAHEVLLTYILYGRKHT
jgi:hypothetical protein